MRNTASHIWQLNLGSEFTTNSLTLIIKIIRNYGNFLQILIQNLTANQPITIKSTKNPKETAHRNKVAIFYIHRFSNEHTIFTLSLKIC